MSASEKKKIKRSRLGCHRCKRLKIKCSEEKPQCSTCLKTGSECDYSLKLTWGGRPYKNAQKGKLAAAGAENGLLSASQMARDLSSVSTLASSVEFVASDFSNSATPMNDADSVGSVVKLESVGSRPGSFSGTVVGETGVDVGDSCEPDMEVVPRSANPWAPGPEKTEFQDIQESRNGSQRTASCAAELVKSERDISDCITQAVQEFAADFPSTLDHHKTTSPDFFATPSHLPAIETPQSEYPFAGSNLDYTDTFSADLARIERAFPSEPRSPFFNTFFGPPSPRKESLDEEEVELELAMVLDHSPEKTGTLIEKRNSLWRSASASHSIPPSIVPLPEILLKVPYYRQLLHFWVDVAADNFVPAPYLYKDNPFKKILPQMAMHYPGILTTILAFAARARDDFEGHDTHSKIIDQLLGRSCDELLKQLQDESEATSDGTFATSLLLSSFEAVHSNDFNKHRAHAIGASQIMVARTKKSRENGHSPTGSDDSQGSSLESTISRRNESDIAYFLLRWHIYVDVIGALSSTRDRGKYLRAYRTTGAYTPVESIPHFDADDSVRDIDFLLGFDPQLLPHFVNISLLIDEVEKYMEAPENDRTCLPHFIVAAALELKDKFYRSYEAGEARRSMIFDEMIEKNGKHAPGRSRDLMNKDNILRSTNKLYYDTGLLNLYRRVLLLPRSSPLVQDLISEMTVIFEYYIEPCSPAEICTIFGLFCAGCDSMDEQKRQFYVARFQELAGQENHNAKKSLVIMERCWETGEDWMTAANMLDIDLVLM